MRETEPKTWVDIDLTVLRTNLRALTEAIGSDRSIILVVKTDSYGHGARAVVDVAEDLGITRFGVASLDEAENLRRSDVTSEILLLHPPLEFEISRVLAAQITPTVSSEETARLLNAASTVTKLPIHIEINTGLNRLGFDWQSAPEAIARIATLPNLTISGIFTHFRTAEPSDTVEVRQQMDRFERALDSLKNLRISPGLCHAASSYVVAYHKGTLCDAIRPGLIAYGGITIDPETVAYSALLRVAPVMSVRSRILHLRSVAEGEWIHYGHAYRAERPMRVAVIPIGYGMGYSRRLSSDAYMLIHGRRAPVVGVTGMDMTIVDLEDVKSVEVGDLVTVLGRDGDETLTAEDLARWTKTIPYEITCSLGNSLPRLITGNSTTTKAMNSTSVAATQ